MKKQLIEATWQVAALASSTVLVSLLATVTVHLTKKHLLD